MAKAKIKCAVSGRDKRVLKIYAAFLNINEDHVIRSALHNQLVAGLKALGLKGKIDKTSANVLACKGGVRFLKAVEKFDTWEQVAGYLNKMEHQPKKIKGPVDGKVADTKPS